jgi:hypothetical protein
MLNFDFEDGAENVPPSAIPGHAARLVDRLNGQARLVRADEPGIYRVETRRKLRCGTGLAADRRGGGPAAVDS